MGASTNRFAQIRCIRILGFTWILTKSHLHVFNRQLNPTLSQWLTPAWAAEAIWEQHFGHVGAGHFVLVPGCGRGAFLAPIPAEVNAVGVEIDPVLAAEANALTGRPVLAGDFRSVPLPSGVTLIIGNPPFNATLIEAFIDRAHALLPEGGEVGFLLPTYIFQTSSKVLAYARRWHIEQQLVPRNLFAQLKLPLLFARFRKTSERRLVGFLLYREAAEVRSLHEPLRETLAQVGRGSRWRHAVHLAFDRLTIETVALRDLYAAMSERLPSETPWWKEQVRKVLQTHPEFEAAGQGRWRRVRLASEAYP
jgi:adenine-specific DNA-methyltransferase